MKANRLWRVLLLLLAACVVGSSEQNESSQPSKSQGVQTNTLVALKAKAEKGDAQFQYELGRAYFDGNLGVATNYVEAVKWFRKAADQGAAKAQFYLGLCYLRGEGVPQDADEAVKWFRKAADQGEAEPQFYLGVCYTVGEGVPQDADEAVRWFRKAADQGQAEAQCALGMVYQEGRGVPQDNAEAVKWYRKAADQGEAIAQWRLGVCYQNGQGVPRNNIVAYKWLSLAVAQNLPDEIRSSALDSLDSLEKRMSRSEIIEAQRLAREFKPIKPPESGVMASLQSIFDSGPAASGTGFFITEDGFLVTNEHVVKDATQIRLVTKLGLVSAKVVRVDAANDLALLKAEGWFTPLPIAPSRGMLLGNTVATVGFPNIGLQGFAPKLAKGEIASLSGPQDDARYFQISVPVQPGNSGGALVDERGNVVGVVAAKLSAREAFKATGQLPENVNYAIKSSYLLSFLESVPEVSAKLKTPNTKEMKFEDVAKSAEQAAALVLVY